MSISAAFGRVRAAERSSRGSSGERGLAGLGRDRHDGNADAVLDVERAGRQARARNEDDSRAGLRRVAGPALDRALVGLHDDRLAGDEADPVRAEEVAEHVSARRARRRPGRPGPASGRRPSRPRSAWRSPGRHRRGCAPARPAPSSDPTRSSASASSTSRRASSVPTASASDAAAGRRDRAEPEPGPAVVPDGGDDERPEACRTGRGARLRAVGKGSVRLDAADERDRRRVLDVAVAVRVDGALEPGEQEVAAPQHGPAALGRLPPAHHPDRQNPRARRDARQAGGPVVADEEPGHAGPVRLEHARLAGLRRRDCAPVAVDDIEAA